MKLITKAPQDLSCISLLILVSIFLPNTANYDEDRTCFNIIHYAFRRCDAKWLPFHDSSIQFCNLASSRKRKLI